MKGIPWRLLGLGSLLGITAALSPGGVFILFLVTATCVALRRWAAQQDRTFLIRIFLIGFILRAGLSLALDVGSCLAEGSPPRHWGPPEYWNLGVADRTRSYIRIGDSDDYSQRGYCLAQYVNGNREAIVLRRISVYGYHGYVLVIGWFYSLFGFSPISVKWLNGWLGGLHILAVFFLAKSCFQSTIARWASIGVALFPTLVLWSATNLKEPLFFLLTALLLLLFTALRANPRFKRWIVYGGGFLAVFWMLQELGRKEVALILVVCLLAALVLEICLRRRWVAVLAFLAVVLMLFNPWARVKQAIHLGAYRHVGYIQTESTTYRYLPDRFYQGPIPLQGGVPSDSDALAMLSRVPTALMHYFLQPFLWWPWKWLALPIIPQMVLWYFLLPLALIGVVAGIRWNVWNCGFLVLTGSAWILVGALSNGNVGTLIRLRDMVTPIVLIFASAGFWIFVRGREGFSREATDRVLG